VGISNAAVAEKEFNRIDRIDRMKTDFEMANWRFERRFL